MRSIFYNLWDRPKKEEKIEMIIGTFKATAGVLRYALGMVSLLFPILFWGIQRNPRNSFSFGYWCHFRFLNASCRYALRFVTVN